MKRGLVAVVEEATRLAAQHFLDPVGHFLILGR